MIRCMKFQVLILENGWVLPFCMPKKATYAIWRLSHFLDFQFSFNLIHSKSVLGSCFHIFDKNLTQKRIATSKLKILRHFPKFWPLITFMWQKVTRDLGGYLEVSQTQSILFLNCISIWYGCFARRVEQGQKIENFTFDSTSDRVWLCYIITDVTDIICNRFGKPDSQKSGLFLHSSEHGIPVLRNL